MIANVWHFPHMCGKSHRPAYFPLSYRWPAKLLKSSKTTIVSLQKQSQHRYMHCEIHGSCNAYQNMAFVNPEWDIIGAKYYWQQEHRQKKVLMTKMLKKKKAFLEKLAVQTHFWKIFVWWIFNHLTVWLNVSLHLQTRYVWERRNRNAKWSGSQSTPWSDPPHPLAQLLHNPIQPQPLQDINHSSQPNQDTNHATQCIH